MIPLHVNVRTVDPVALVDDDFIGVGGREPIAEAALPLSLRLDRDFGMRSVGNAQLVAIVAADVEREILHMVSVGFTVAGSVDGVATWRTATLADAIELGVVAAMSRLDEAGKLPSPDEIGRAS